MYARTRIPTYFLLVFLLTFAVFSCQGSGGQPIEAVLGEPFTLEIGESAIIGDQNVALTFVEVIRDVRCPTLVTCAEKGPVEISVTLQIQSSQTTRYEMNPEQVPEFLGWAPNHVSTSGFVVELQSVDPYPEMPEDMIDFSHYQATFVIKQNE